MGFLSQRVERCDLKAGDHIYSWRTPVFAYSHHGIYIGDDKVVHFTQEQNFSPGGSPSFCVSSSAQAYAVLCLDSDCASREHESGVVMSCLNCFLGGGSLYRFEYGVRPVVLMTKVRSGTCTVAKSDPPEDVIHRAKYLLQNGGFWKSGASGQVSSFISIPMAVMSYLPLKMLVSNLVALVAMPVQYSFNRYACDIGVRDDVIKVEVENIASFLAFVH
ncbi:protein LEAD-SENSITIVE 1-like [Salvia divinorum]|uniref:Protein LEAD-SENSITIVE 1-like n=1 Tax=Salvia divinorum TaxID=28513 RepID=A0ABD1GGL2_SALDI